MVVDGLGFEEVNQEVTETEVLSGANVYASVGVTTIDVVATGTVTAGQLTDGNGLLESASVGSPEVYGTRVQVGTVITAAGSDGTIEFGTPFATSGYKVSLTAGSTTDVTGFTSGTRNVSGCEMVGAASTRYDFIAVGL